MNSIRVLISICVVFDGEYYDQQNDTYDFGPEVVIDDPLHQALHHSKMVFQKYDCARREYQKTDWLNDNESYYEAAF